MNKKTTAIIAAIIAILAIVGIVIAINMNNDKNDGANNQTNQTANSNVDPSKEFNPQPVDSLSYVATSTTTVSGQTIESTTESDGEGTMKTSSTAGGMKSESYIKGDTITTCVNDECSTSKVDASAEESAAAMQDASQYKDSAKHSGTEACPAGTCQVWKATGPAGDVTYYIDDQNRISKITMSGTSTEVTYEYKDVSITIPTV